MRAAHRARSGSLRLLLNQLHELPAISGQLRLSHAHDRGELLQCRRLALRHFPQARVVEDDVRRHARFVGESLAQRAERFKERVARARRRRREGLRGLATAGRFDRLTDSNGPLAFQHLPARVVQCDHRISILGLRHQALMQQCPGDVAPLLHAEMLADSVDAQSSHGRA